MSPLFVRMQEIVETQSAGGARQMAADEFLLAEAQEPALRFFIWDTPQVTFGYFGDYLALRERLPDKILTRRWTGGGVVFHGDDITFSLVIPISSPLAKEKGEEIYRRIHGCVQEALSAAGVAADLAESGNAPRGSDCFAAPVAHDVVGESGKLAGGAMRRTRAGLLYQGSVLGVSASLREQVKEKMRERFCQEKEPKFFSQEDLDAIGQIAAARYASLEWLQTAGGKKF